MKKVLILSGFGINCENEVKYAFEKAGGDAEILHSNEVMKDKDILDKYDIVVIPGGFSFGDNLGAGFALASLMRVTILDKMKEMIEQGKIFVGICNGCQVLIKLGLFNDGDRNITITHNKGNIGYKCIWRDCESTNSWHFDGIAGSIKLPVAHGEGRFIDLDKEKNKNLDEKKIMIANNEINKNCKIILKYSKNQNHNGSDYDVAAISNGRGNVIAMMPHPERAICIDENSKNSNNVQNTSSISEKNKLESLTNSIYIRFFYNLLSKNSC